MASWTSTITKAVYGGAREENGDPSGGVKKMLWHNYSCARSLWCEDQNCPCNFSTKTITAQCLEYKLRHTLEWGKKIAPLTLAICNKAMRQLKFVKAWPAVGVLKRDIFKFKICSTSTMTRPDEVDVYIEYSARKNAGKATMWEDNEKSDHI